MFGRRRRLLSILVVMGLALPAPAQTRGPLRCNVHMMKGDWGFTCTGMAANPLVPADPKAGPPIQPFAMNGTFSSDGKGQVRGPGWANFNGMIVQQFASTISTEPAVVNPDCTGSIHYVLSIGGPDGSAAGEMDFAMVQLNENDILGMPTSPGMAVTCRVTRLHAKN